MAALAGQRQRWHATHAWLPGGLAADVTLEALDGRFTDIAVGTGPAGHKDGSATKISGLVLPGFANAHSHAFHRALRGRTHAERGSFWTWRQQMYAVAQRLDPDTYLALATATYAEMALAGVSAVGEFHYLHHGPGGRRYDDPNAMGLALVEAAKRAGIRLTLLDTCYLSGGLSGEGHLPLDPVQQRFADVDVGDWVERFARLNAGPSLRIGVGVHSVRAVPAAVLPTLAEVARERVLHVHLSEQLAENAASLAFYGITPTALLARHGILGPASTVIHATHLADHDIGLVGASGTSACLCPTTERDLADGIGPARRLLNSGAPLCLGSDQHAVIDLLEEARALEMDERLASGQRSRFQPAELMAALTSAGQRSIDWPDAGKLEVGGRADLVAVRLDTPRTAGVSPDQAILAATNSDIDTVVVDGRTVVKGGRHVLGDIGVLLRQAIEPLWVEQ